MGLERLLGAHPTDWTIVWRALAEVPAAHAQPSHVWIQLLGPAFYRPLDAHMEASWVEWLRSWLDELRRRTASGAPEGEPPVGSRDAMGGAAAANREVVADAGNGGAVSATADDVAVGSTPFDGAAIGDAMRRASPKYVPREWMLAEAYGAAEQGDYALVRSLHELLTTPYDEHPEAATRFYRRRPAGVEQQGGIGFMS